MAKTRTVVSRIAGGIQYGLGILSLVFAVLVYASPSIRNALAITHGEVYLYIFLFSVFGILSILSGSLLLREEK